MHYNERYSSMIYRIIFKDFKSNIKNNICFFLANSIGIAEFFVFWGMYTLMEKIMKSGVTGEDGIYDIVLSVGAIAIFSTVLMVYSMMNYVRLRLRNYSLFVIIGMKKRTMYLLLALEYFMGWISSFLLGILTGRILLRGVLKIWHEAFPEYVGAANVGTSVYLTTCKVGFAIMAAVFFALMVWTGNRDLSSLTVSEEAKEKRPKKLSWFIAVFAGLGLMGFGYFQYSGSVARGWPYVYSHLEWIMGGFLVVAFGGGMLLEVIHNKHEDLYIRNLLKFNRLYSKYQSNLLFFLMLLSVHFLALSYCVARIAEMQPIGNYEKYYPYDAIWMAQENDKDQAFSEMLVKKYNGTEDSLPMIRVTNYFSAEHIGISASSYKEITGKQCELTGSEIIFAVSERKSLSERTVKSDMYKELNQWLVPGKLTDYWNRYITSPDTKMAAKDLEHHFQLQNVHVQNWFGEYGVASNCEDVVVFSDDYFKEQRQRMLKNPEESTVLKLFSFPEECRKQALKKLKDYVDTYGVKDSEWTAQKQSSLYVTEETVLELEKADIFKLSNKLFIMIILFLSGLFAVMIKTISELPSYRKRYEFLECMGIRRKMRKKTISIEIQSIPDIAVFSAAILSVPYLQMHILRQNSRGIVLDKKIWLYWFAIVMVYLGIEYVFQKIFAIYMNHIISD